MVLISFGLSNTLLLPFALKALNATEFEYGLQEGLTSIGFVVGSLLMAKIFDRLQAGAWLAISFLGMGLVGIVYSSLHSVPLAIAIITISGFFNAPSSIGRRVIVQRNTPPEMRGRVSSVFFVCARCALSDRHERGGSRGYHGCTSAVSHQRVDAVGWRGSWCLFIPESGTVARTMEADLCPA